MSHALCLFICRLVNNSRTPDWVCKQIQTGSHTPASGCCCPRQLHVFKWFSSWPGGAVNGGPQQKVGPSLSGSGLPCLKSQLLRQDFFRRHGCCVCPSDDEVLLLHCHHSHSKTLILQGQQAVSSTDPGKCVRLPSFLQLEFNRLQAGLITADANGAMTVRSAFRGRSP